MFSLLPALAADDCCAAICGAPCTDVGDCRERKWSGTLAGLVELDLLDAPVNVLIGLGLSASDAPDLGAIAKGKGEVDGVTTEDTALEGDELEATSGRKTGWAAEERGFSPKSTLLWLACGSALGRLLKVVPMIPRATPDTTRSMGRRGRFIGNAVREKNKEAGTVSSASFSVINSICLVSDYREVIGKPSSARSTSMSESLTPFAV